MLVCLKQKIGCSSLITNRWTRLSLLKRVVFDPSLVYSTFLLINDQNTKWGAATLVTNATIWSFHSMYHYIVIYYRWLHSILRLSPSVRFCVHLMAAIMAKHKSCQIDIGRSNGKTQGGGIMLKMSKMPLEKVLA